MDTKTDKTPLLVPIFSILSIKHQKLLFYLAILIEKVNSASLKELTCPN